MGKTRGQTHGCDISASRHDDRNSGCCALCGVNADPAGHDDIDIFVDELGGGLGEPLRVAAGEAKLDLDRFALDVPEVAKSSEKFAIAIIGASPGAEVADAREGTALLSARRKRPNGRAAEECEERAPPHSITSSAAASRACGGSRPSARAVLRLIVRKKREGCSTGMSAGRAPSRIAAISAPARLEEFGDVFRIGHEPAGLDVLAEGIDGGKPRRGRQLGKQRRVEVRLGVLTDHEGVGALAQSALDRRPEIGFRRRKDDRNDDEGDALSRGRRLDRRDLNRAQQRRLGSEEGELRHRGNHLSQKRDPFAPDGGAGVHGDAGDVAAGMGEALDEALPDEVGRKNHNRNRVGHALKERPANSADEDDVRPAGDDPLSQRFKARGVFLLPVDLHLEVVSFDMFEALELVEHRRAQGSSPPALGRNARFEDGEAPGHSRRLG